MKKALLALALCTQIGWSGTALAYDITVDFVNDPYLNTLDADGNPIQVNLTQTPYWINGISFSFESADTQDPSIQTFLDTLGIYGSTWGLLKMEFQTPDQTFDPPFAPAYASALSFDYDLAWLGDPLLGSDYPTVGDALDVTLNNSTDSTFVPVNFPLTSLFTPYDGADLTLGGYATGFFDSGNMTKPFNQAFMIFTAGAFQFDVWNVSYTPYDPSGGGPAPVPEPATMLLMATGLAGLGSRRLFRKKEA